MDKISIQGIEFYAYHGVYPAEQELGQRYRVDVECFLDLKTPGETDRLEDTINYAEVVDLVTQIMEQKPPVKLIETLAEEICHKLLECFSLLEAVSCRVIKPDPPIRGHYQHVSVEILRRRDHGKN